MKMWPDLVIVKSSTVQFWFEILLEHGVLWRDTCFLFRSGAVVSLEPKDWEVLRCGKIDSKELYSFRCVMVTAPVTTDAEWGYAVLEFLARYVVPQAYSCVDSEQAHAVHDQMVGGWWQSESVLTHSSDLGFDWACVGLNCEWSPRSVTLFCFVSVFHHLQLLNFQESLYRHQLI